MSCPHCHDTGWRTIPRDEASRVERCVCWRQSVAQTMLTAAKIPPRYRTCDLESFVTYENDQLLRAVERARGAKLHHGTLHLIAVKRFGIVCRARDGCLPS